MQTDTLPTFDVDPDVNRIVVLSQAGNREDALAIAQSIRTHRGYVPERVQRIFPEIAEGDVTDPYFPPSDDIFDPRRPNDKLFRNFRRGRIEEDLSEK